MLIADAALTHRGPEPAWMLAPYTLLFLWMYVSPVIAIFGVVFTLKQSTNGIPDKPLRIASLIVHGVIFSVSSALIGSLLVNGVA